jgi:hypothetical protein
MGFSAWRETIESPAFRFWPRFTRRMPSGPEKGALIVFLAIVARMLSAAAAACF